MGAPAVPVVLKMAVDRQLAKSLPEQTMPALQPEPGAAPSERQSEAELQALRPAER